MSRPVSLPRPDGKCATYLDFKDPTTRHLLQLVFNSSFKLSYAYLSDLRDYTMELMDTTDPEKEAEKTEKARQKAVDDHKAHVTTIISGTVVQLLGRP